MLLDILENHVVSIMSNAFITLPLYIDRVRARNIKYPNLDEVKWLSTAYALWSNTEFELY